MLDYCLITDLKKICEYLRQTDFDQSVSDMGNYAADVAAQMIEEAIEKKEKTVEYENV